MTSSEQAIANLVAIYAERIDAGDFDGVGALFEHAHVSADNGVVLGDHDPASVAATYVAYTRRFDDGTPRTKHVTTNLIIEVDETAGTGSCRSYFTVFQQTETLALQPVIAGRYHDEFAVIEGRWQFTKRYMMSDLFGDLSEHMLQTID
ncbi:MAG: nuclear transport factor 2 family protein [Acidimicrobiales bacterium]|nr:nuclear transport factor 2 family protein [Acidimicrobiales bacterium]